MTHSYLTYARIGLRTPKGKAFAALGVLNALAAVRSALELIGANPELLQLLVGESILSPGLTLAITTFATALMGYSLYDHGIDTQADTMEALHTHPIFKSVTDDDTDD